MIEVTLPGGTVLDVEGDSAADVATRLARYFGLLADQHSGTPVHPDQFAALRVFSEPVTVVDPDYVEAEVDEIEVADVSSVLGSRGEG